MLGLSDAPGRLPCARPHRQVSVLSLQILQGLVDVRIPHNDFYRKCKCVVIAGSPELVPWPHVLVLRALGNKGRVDLGLLLCPRPPSWSNSYRCPWGGGVGGG